jgi:hypothetical protein
MEIRKIELLGFINGYIKCLEMKNLPVTKQDVQTTLVFAYNSPIYRSAVREICEELETWDWEK